MAFVSKRIKKINTELDKSKQYSLADAVKVIKEHANAKFDEAIEIAMNLNVDAKKAEQNLRGVLQLPNGTGKTYRIAVFAKGPKADEAREAGADIIGAEDLVEQIQKGEINFDKCIATPDMMGMAGRVARILGPRGIMPNPKTGTVTVNVAKAVKDVKGGQVEYRTEKNGVIHAGVGKASFKAEALQENIQCLVDTIQKARPAGVKGAFVKKMSLSSTMGGGVEFLIS